MSSSSSIALLVPIAAALLAAGCATTEPRMSTAQVERVPASGPTIIQDVAYVQRVEKLASRRNVGVVWVHPPSRRIAAASPTP